MKQIPKRVMIVSFDAVGAKDLEYLQTLPNFRRFFEQAALCSHCDRADAEKSRDCEQHKNPAQPEGSGLALSSQMDPQHDAL